MDKYKIIENALSVFAGGVVFAVWVYITVDLFGIAFASDGLSGYEWFLFGLGYALFTVILLLAGIYLVDATREDREDV